jgi:hypothetical protein
VNGFEKLSAFFTTTTAAAAANTGSETTDSATLGGWDTIKLRRVEAKEDADAGHDSSSNSSRGGGAPFVHFHTDFSRRTMQVALNGEEEYEGGRLVFATGSAGFVRPSRPAGSATIHSGSIAHGVTALVSGVRYSLFLCDTTGNDTVKGGNGRSGGGGDGDDEANKSKNGSAEKTDEEAAALALSFLADAAVQQFAFFKQAAFFLEKSSDADLAAVVHEYTSFLATAVAALPSSSARGVASTPTAPSFAVELAWRCHLLRPLHYKQDCLALRASAADLPSSSPCLVDHCCPCVPPAADLSSSNTAKRSESTSITEEVSTEEVKLGLDVVAAMRRQQAFVSSGALSALEAQFQTQKLAAAAVRDYARFLVSMRSNSSPVSVPSLSTDLIWHAHMLLPRRYAEDCRRFAGHEVDHDDEAEIGGLAEDEQ